MTMPDDARARLIESASPLEQASLRLESSAEAGSHG
jgi:hypothetical protein